MASKNGLMLLTALMVCSLSGCGTVGNLWSCCRSGDHVPYGGVVNSVKLASSGIEEAAKLDLPACPLYLLASAYFLVVDAPLCVVADTLTLPITIPATFHKETVNLSEKSPKSELERYGAMTMPPVVVPSVPDEQNQASPK